MPRKWYSTIWQIAGMHHQGNRVSIAGCEQYNWHELATHINEYFSVICLSLPALDTTSLPAPSGPPSVTRSQVWRQLVSVWEHKAPKPDNFRNRILKVFAFELSEPVTNIIKYRTYRGKVWFQVNGGRRQWCRCQRLSQLRQLISWDHAASLMLTLAKVTEFFASRRSCQTWMRGSTHAMQFGNRRDRSTSY